MGFEPDELSRAGLARVDAEIDLYVKAAEGRAGVALRPYWAERAKHMPLEEAERRACLGGLIKADMRRRFDLGEAPAVAEYLEQFPSLREADSRVVSLVYEEFCLREENGEALDVDEFCERYPGWKDSLISQLGYHRLLSRAAGMTPPKPKFPDEGGRFEEFTLLHQIGRGGYSRVFLARDGSLGGKKVVLKVSIDRGQEAETQGALDHPHIVPVNSVAFQTATSLRGLSMPYRPGLPLDDVIRRVRNGRGRRGASARILWDALVEGVEPDREWAGEDLVAAMEAGPSTDGWRGFPVKGPFSQGVAWIGMTLARALAYAHDRNTFHRDVKPGNVLLTVQHGPQLLDFNLAKSPHEPREAHSAIQGGTLPYMAPEQIEAFLNPDRWADVGAAADIYSLGLVLREMLTGQPLDVPDSNLPPPRALRDLLDRRRCLSVDVRAHDLKVPHALEAIVRKCLRHDPAERYASAKDLAEDLESFLKLQPLPNCVNPSRRERAMNWAARNRRSLALHGFYLAVLAALSPMVLREARLLRNPDPKLRPEFAAAFRDVDDGRFIEAMDSLKVLGSDYPDSALVLIYTYLAESRAETLPLDPQSLHFIKAMEQPGADADLRDWAKQHTQFTRDLARVGFAAIEKMNSAGQTVATPKQRAEFERIVAATDRILTNAAAVTLPADQGWGDIQQGLAGIAEIRKDYRRAHDILTGIIDGRTMDGRPAKRKSNTVVNSRVQRARIKTIFAEQEVGLDREEGAPRRLDPEHSGRALGLIAEAVKDLDDCLTRTSPKAVQYCYSHKTDALLLRSRIYGLLGSRDLAKSDSRRAKEARGLWFSAVEVLGDVINEDTRNLYREKFTSLDALIDALADGG